MLMRTKTVDYFFVEPKHEDIDKRLENWARWVAVRRPSWVSPMFRMARSNTRQWHAPEPSPECNPLDAAKVESTIAGMPALHRSVIRWCYVYRYGAMKFRQEHGLTEDRLLSLISNARQILTNTI